MTRVQRTVAVALLMMLSAGAAVTLAAQGCTDPIATIDFGITDLDCLQCTVHASGMLNWVDFGAEPVVRNVTNRASPIQPGDVLVALDGKLITGFAGARLLAHPEAGHAVRFTVRRNGRQMDISVLPGSICPPDIMTAAAKVAAAAKAKPTEPSSGAAVDSFFRNLVRLHDTIELHYERDAYGRPYHFTFNGDSSSLDVPAPVQMKFEPEGRLLLITDSVGRRKFYETHPVRGSGGRRIDSTKARREDMRWQFGQNLGPMQTDTLPNGTVRTIWHEGTDTVFTIPNGGKAGAGVGSGFQIGRFGFLEPEVLITTQPDGSIRTISNGGRDTTYQIRSARRSWGGSDSVGTNRIEANTTMTRGWLGLALECVRCSMDRGDPTDRDITVRFTAPPRVAAIKPGVAADAGFKPGDVIRTIDGQSMITAAGSDRFANLHPGDRVKFVVDRDGRSIVLTLVVPKGI